MWYVDDSGERKKKILTGTCVLSLNSYEEPFFKRLCWWENSNGKVVGYHWIDLIDHPNNDYYEGISCIIINGRFHTNYNENPAFTSILRRAICNKNTLCISLGYMEGNICEYVDLWLIPDKTYDTAQVRAYIDNLKIQKKKKQSPLTQFAIFFSHCFENSSRDFVSIDYEAFLHSRKKGELFYLSIGINDKGDLMRATKKSLQAIVKSKYDSGKKSDALLKCFTEPACGLLEICEVMELTENILEIKGSVQAGNSNSSDKAAVTVAFVSS